MAYYWNSPTLLEVQNGTAALGNSLAVSYKVKHTPAIWPDNSNTRYEHLDSTSK